MEEPRYITNGGIPGKYNLYFSDWTYKINTDFDPGDREIKTVDEVMAINLAENPPSNEPGPEDLL